MTVDELTATLPEGFERQVWVYVGRRLNSARKLVPVFLTTDIDPADPDDVGRRFFDKADIPTSQRPGARYEVVTRDHGATMYTRGALGPRFIELPNDDDRATGWAIEERLAKIGAETARAETRATKTEDPFVALCAPLKAALRKQVGYSRRAAFIAAVIEELTR